MKSIISALFVMALAGPANASLCKLSADVSGASWKIGVGGTEMSGVGQIKCLKDGQFRTVEVVKVDMIGGGFGLGFKKIKNAKLFSTGVGFVQSADALMGQFLFVKAGAHVGPIGADAGASIYFNAKKDGKKGVAIPFGLNFAKGLGLELGIDILEVTVTPLSSEL